MAREIGSRKSTGSELREAVDGGSRLPTATGSGSGDYGPRAKRSQNAPTLGDSRQSNFKISCGTSRSNLWSRTDPECAGWHPFIFG